MNFEQSAIGTMARWSVAHSFGATPPTVLETARRSIIDTVGVALAGSLTDVGVAGREYARSEGARSGATLIGKGFGRVAPAAAAFANATAGHALDFDDNCYAGVVHGSVVVLPAALAVAEHVDATGADLLAAFIVGSECQYALGQAAGRQIYDAGWWTTGVFGVVGAAAAAARLLGLSEEQAASALGIAISGTGSMKACFGTDAKPLLAGAAAAAGVRAALLAKAGCSGPWDAVERGAGFASLFCMGRHDASALSTLGMQWRLDLPGVDIKRIPVCLSSHAAVDVLRDLLAETPMDPSEVDRIVCDVPPIVIRNLVHAQPRNTTEARFSMHFALAAVLVYGDVTPEALTDGALSAPAMRRAMEKTELVSGARWNDARMQDLAPEGAHLAIHLRDGRILDGMRARPLGSAAAPLTDALLHSKFMTCATRLLSLEQAGRVYRSLGALESLTTSRDLFQEADSEPTLRR